MAKYLKSTGMTLLETIVSLTVVMIMTIASLMLLTQASQMYTKSKAMQESLGRIKNHVPLILNQIRGAQAIYTTNFPSVGIRFNYYNQAGNLACGRLKWNSQTKDVIFYENPSTSNNCSGQWNSNTIFISNVDRLQFDTYSPGILKLDYDINIDGADPTNCIYDEDPVFSCPGVKGAITYNYKLMYTPKLPESE